MKKLNRLDKIRLASRRESLSKEKLIVDSNRLKLQNLIYECEHLKKEIHKCVSFKSEDEDIELVAIDEFMSSISDDKKESLDVSDEHSLRLARLELELQQRKDYDEKCKELEKKKEEVSMRTVNVKENLDSLGPCLVNVFKATRPIQKILNMPFEAEWEVEEVVRLLPQPLYMAYTKLCAYSEVIDKLLEVKIEGNEEEAKILKEHEKKSKESDETVHGEEMEDSDNEAEENDYEENENRRALQRRQSKVESMNERREKFFSHHPLSIQFVLKLRNSKESMSVTLIYLPEMNIVTVQGKFNIENQSVAAGDILTQDRILSSLYADDVGLESPNSRTIFQLQNLNFNQSEFSKLLDDKKLGKPYKWAQRLCGINPKQTSISLDESNQLCQETVPHLIRQIRRRINARMKLYHQIRTLEIGKVSSSSSFKISSILQQFVPLSYSEYASISYVKRFIDEKIVNEVDIFYRAILTRGSCKLECYIAVPSNFPSNLPVFAIELNLDHKYNAETSPHIRQIENYINSIGTEKIDEILSLQLQRAMCSMDIFLETSSDEFRQEKNFVQCFRGRGRERPYQPKVYGKTTSFHHNDY